MSERVYTTIDKSSWGPGTWQDEPDKVQWREEETGLPCLAKRGPGGHWCGYVGVSEGHPAFERDYTDIDVRIHGGLTYAEHCAEGPEDEAICHVPESGEADYVWWLGFDCAHLMDYSPAHAAADRKRYEDTGDPIWLNSAFDRGEYRTLGYVRAETESLARQLAVSFQDSEPSS